MAFGFIWGDKILIDVILIKLFPECYRYQLASTEREKEGVGREKNRRKERGRVGGREEVGEKKEKSAASLWLRSVLRTSPQTMTRAHISGSWFCSDHPRLGIHPAVSTD